MALEAGTRLGPYEIVELLGKGGMGEVYRAHDTRLDRDVAVKVLPAELSGDETYRRRLEREAKTISQLQHPNVCTLHDIGSEGATQYLVMEYLEGETLEDRLRKGALPVDDVLRIGSEIAEAVGTAHRAGVVHRDLKPGNVMLTKTGTKVLDFGLAREFASPGEAVNTQAATVAAITGEGTLVGTMPYMAPEQLQGSQADSRTDIWALGCILYETATGERPFGGDTQASLIGAILKDDPEPPSRKQPLTPGRLDWVVKRCLEKDPERRWQSSRDVAIELESIEDRALPQDERSAESLALRFPMLLAVAVAVLLGTGIGWFLWGRGSGGGGPNAKAATRQPLGWPAGMEADPVVVRHFGALSPNGSTFVYRAGNQLRVWRLGEIDSLPLRGTENGFNPFFSPDGQSVAFFTDRELRRVNVAGGIAERICEVSEGLIGAWGPGDTILYGMNGSTGLWEVSASGGSSVQRPRARGSRPRLHGLPSRRLRCALYSQACVGGLGRLEDCRSVASHRRAQDVGRERLLSTLFTDRSSRLCQEGRPFRGGHGHRYDDCRGGSATHPG